MKLILRGVSVFRLATSRFAWAALLVSPLLLCTANAAENAPPNFLWINCEDISPALGCYGDRYATTPNLDRLAARGIVFRNAFATAPICSPARSCLITGVYATSLGTQHLRCRIEKPDFIRCLPEYLRDRGYFCTNSGKTDWNFDPAGVWDYWATDTAPWRQRPAGRPFFSMFTIGTTHEGRVNFAERYQQAVADLPDEMLHDPAAAELPPFYPDTPAMRRIWARQYDLVARMDAEVGEILQRLDDDGLSDHTIVFFFSDHGFGLPRYKRWLNDSGLRVPLVVRIPPRFQHLSDDRPGSTAERLVSFVDFAPTVLQLAGSERPPHMQGVPFLGLAADTPRAFIHGERSRADDMFETSRAVHNGRWIYVRHYEPHRPYLQGGEIFADKKESFAALRVARAAGIWNEHAEKMFADRKPVEELYDLEKDPHELHNLAGCDQHRELLAEMRAELQRWILASRDTGFLNEAEYKIRAAENTPYEMAQDPQRYDLPRILAAAEMVGHDSVPINDLLQRLGDRDSGVRYWAATALLSRDERGADVIDALTVAVGDRSPSVAIVAAEALCQRARTKAALPVLARWLTDDRPAVALHAARTTYLIGRQASPLVPTIQQVIDANRSPPGSPRPWKDFDYAAFTTWSLEWALKNCGH